MANDQALQQEFKSQFVHILKDMKDNAQKDPETLWLIGSLANEIVQKGEKRNWPELKSALAPEAYDELLEQFQTQGNALSKKGNIKAAYAVQTVATSLVASRMNDADLATGVQLMDAFIAQAVKFFKSAEAKSKSPN